MSNLHPNGSTRSKPTPLNRKKSHIITNKKSTTASLTEKNPTKKSLTSDNTFFNLSNVLENKVSIWNSNEKNLFNQSKLEEEKLQAAEKAEKEKKLLQEAKIRQFLITEALATQTPTTTVQNLSIFNPLVLIGPTGPQGPQGAQGQFGPQGGIGKAGPDGNIGPPGPKGKQGIIGPQGAQGFRGQVGKLGAVGDIGFQGIGPLGYKGFQGPQGPPGPFGPQGTQGIKGFQGRKGPQGAIGNLGFQGPPGSIGLKGNQGPLGPIGLAGPPGAIGNPGDPSTSGPKGMTGPQGSGPQGPMGSPGANNIAPGLPGPQGIQGNQGYQGDGAQGATGDVGEGAVVIRTVPYATNWIGTISITPSSTTTGNDIVGTQFLYLSGFRQNSHVELCLTLQMITTGAFIPDYFDGMNTYNPGGEMFYSISIPVQFATNDPALYGSIFGNLIGVVNVNDNYFLGTPTDIIKLDVSATRTPPVTGVFDIYLHLKLGPLGAADQTLIFTMFLTYEIL